MVFATPETSMPVINRKIRAFVAAWAMVMDDDGLPLTEVSGDAVSGGRADYRIIWRPMLVRMIHL